MKSYKQSESTSKPTKSVTKKLVKKPLSNSLKRPVDEIFTFSVNAIKDKEGTKIKCDAEGRNGFAVDVFARVMMEDNNMADILVRAVSLFLDSHLQSKINEQIANEKKTKAKGGSNTAKRKAKAKV